MTLDDDLFETRAVENQAKNLSNRKADREVHTTDVVEDNFSRYFLPLVL